MMISNARSSSSPAPAASVSGEAPYFADGVYARAKANRDKLAGYNRARVDEPRALAAAIRKQYANHPLVAVLKQSLHELSEEHHCECYLRLGAPTFLVLTRDGFYQGGSGTYDWSCKVLGESVPVGERGTAAAARTRIDAMLATFAEDPEKHVIRGPPIPQKVREEVPETQKACRAAAKKRRGFFRRLFHRR